MSQARILVVEDQAIVARDLQRMLLGLGYDVPAIVSLGEKALPKVAELLPDLILMDVRLKGKLNGIATATQIRECFDIPVIYLTAYADQDTLQQAKLTQPYGYIIKPFEERDLDITIQMALYKHRMEKALKEKERWLATTLTSIGDGVLTTDTHGYITFLNEMAQTLTGWTEIEALGKPVTDIFKIIHETTRQPVENPLIRALQKRTMADLSAHTLLIAKNGSELPINDRAAPIRDEWGDLTGAVLVFRDISQRKQAEQALHQTRLDYEKLVDSINGIVWEADARTFQFTFVSKQAERLLGYPVEDWLVEPTFWVDHIHSDDRAWAVDFCQTATREKRSHEFEYRMLTADGRLIWVRDIVTVILEDEQPAKLRGVIIDITERKQLEDQLRQAQKMEAVGQLAAGIAHNFNNLLTAILGYAGLAMESLSADNPVVRDLQGIHKTARRAANLTQQLLAFTRHQMIRRQILDLNNLIIDLNPILRQLINETIELIVLTEPDLGQVKIDPGQFEQVLVNLVVNARDAMPKGGKLVIKTANKNLDQPLISQYGEIHPGRYVRLTVSDTGIGMTKPVQDHIFEPFFTTKETGQGTGLGLATCFGIIQQNNGHIVVHSRPDWGTVFEIYLLRFDQISAYPLGRP